MTPRHNLHTSTRLPGALPSALEVPAGEAPGGVASTHARPRATEFPSGSPGPNRSSSQSSSSPRTRGLPQSVWCPWKRTKTPVPQDSLSPPNRYIEADGRLHLLSPSPPKPSLETPLVFRKSMVFIHVRRLEGAIRIVACAAPSIGGRPYMYEGTLHRYCRAKYR